MWAVLLLTLLSNGCVDQDPFGFANRDVVGGYCLHKFESGSYYLHDANGRDVIEGVVIRLGWNDEYIIAWRQAFSSGDPDGWMHEGALVSVLVTPKDCSCCHVREYEEFSRSHHAKAGEIIMSLDNVLALQAAGTPDNPADG